MTVLGLFLNEEMRTGGHRRYLELLEGLAARGNSVRAILNERLPQRPAGVEAVRIHAPYIRAGFPPVALRFRVAVKRALPEIRRMAEGADCLLVHGETHFLAARVVARATGIPIVFGHRSNAVQEVVMLLREKRRSPRARLVAAWETLKYRRYERLIAREAALVVFQSVYDRDDFRSRAPLAMERTAVIGGSIGGPRFPEKLALSNRSRELRRVIFVGTWGPRKGARYLVEAIEILARRGFDGLRFRLIGPGPDRSRYEERFAANGLAHMVRLEGRIDNPLAAVAEADLMVVPSLFDSYPDTVLEALHVGTPVIGSRCGGIPELLAHDELLVPVMDAPAIADRIERCVREPEFYRGLRRLCEARRAALTFDWPQVWERVIRQVLKKA